MPDQNAGDIYRRLNAVERAVEGHLGACGEQNKARQRWERNTDNNIASIVRRLGKLEGSQARMMGWLAGASAVGSAIGAAAMAWLTKG